MADLTALVDAQLRSARELLGAGNPPLPPPPDQPLPQPSTPQGWSGPAQQRSTEQATDNNRMRHRIGSANTQVHNAITQTQPIGPKALQQLSAVESQWATDRATLRSQGATPEAAAGLAQAGRHRVAEARQIMSAAAAAYAESAEAVRAARRQLPLAHVDTTPPPPPLIPNDTGVPDPASDRPYICYLGSKDNDPVKVCGPIPALHTYYVDNGRFVQVEGGKPDPAAQVEIDVGPGEIIDTNINPDGTIGEVQVWLAGPPTQHDFDNWSEHGKRGVNFRWLQPDGSLGVDRRWQTGEYVHRGFIPPGLDLAP